MAEKQVKSRQRVADHGEVFTAEREVKAMCDLVKSETERIESRFLEPACGNGNFLAEVLRRKLAVVKSRYRVRYRTDRTPQQSRRNAKHLPRIRVYRHYGGSPQSALYRQAEGQPHNESAYP